MGEIGDGIKGYTYQDEKKKLNAKVYPILIGLSLGAQNI